ncbi:MAG: hypothetical protein ABL994_01715 [Verrucomicrobiales bacterium]
MKKFALTWRLLILLFTSVCLAQEKSPAENTIDWSRAQNLYQRSQRGEKLSAEDQVYLDRAKVIRSQGKGPSGNRPGVSQRQAPAQMIPLSDMSAQDRYEGQDGGLYGGGRNTPDDKLRTIAEAQLAKIQKLDADGRPAADGKIAFISISMSNATQEFSRFKQIADQSAEKSAALTIVDCAQGGQAMAEWVPADGNPWKVAMQRLQQAVISPKQVQVAWVKLANKVPSGTFADHGKKLESDTIQVLKNARNKFPNLQIAYLGSRIWAGHAKGVLNPEPYAYESGFVARELIQRQSSGDASLGLEAAPLLLWGPYLWAEGAKGRKLDSLIWEPGDFESDGVHPSPSGRDKVAQLLLKFVTTDPLAKPWFVKK